jgi:hypothetical protein
MATIEKRGQFWRVKIRRTGLPAQTRTFDNRTQAQQWARGLETEIENGVLVDRRAAEGTSLAEILDRYRLEVTPTKRGARDENLRLKAMALRPFAGTRMAALTSSDLAAYRDERLKVVSGATVNREFNVLSHAIDTARREWDIYLPFNPCTGPAPSSGQTAKSLPGRRRRAAALESLPPGTQSVALAFRRTRDRNRHAAQ